MKKVQRRSRTPSWSRDRALWLEALFRAMPLGVVAQNGQGRVTDANPAAERLLGLTLDQMRGLTFADPRWRVVREDGTELPAAEYPARIALQTGRRVEGLVLGIDAPGRAETRWLRVGVTPHFRAGADRPFQVCSVFEDVTAQRAFETGFRRSEERQRFALEGAGLGTWTWDIATDRMSVSQTARALLGLGPDTDLTRAQLAERLHPEDRPISRRTIERALMEDTPYEMEYRLRWPDGTEHWIASRGRAYRDDAGRPVRFEGTLQDIDGRKAAETTLREAAQRQRALLREVLASVTGEKLCLVESERDLPAPLALAADPIRLTREQGLRELRATVRTAARGLGFPDARWQDLITAVQEGGMNAVVHGGGSGEGMVSTDGSGSVQVRVHDWGPGIASENLPRAALLRGWSTGASLGHGMAMMLGSVDRVWLLTGPEGTTVVLEQAREEPTPAWLMAV